LASQSKVTILVVEDDMKLCGQNTMLRPVPRRALNSPERICNWMGRARLTPDLLSRIPPKADRKQLQSMRFANLPGEDIEIVPQAADRGPLSLRHDLVLAIQFPGGPRNA